jgi:hypothetical protein
MGLITKRFVPSKEPAAKKVKRTVEKPKKVKLETNKKFASIYKDLKAKQEEQVPVNPSLDFNWLASLTGESRQISGDKETDAIHSKSSSHLEETKSIAKWRIGLIVEDFLPSEKNDPEYFELKKFVREDCKQQLKAVKRKLKGRMQI